MQALKIHSPDVFLVCAFTFAVARWMHPACWIVAYVHYLRSEYGYDASNGSGNKRIDPDPKTLKSCIIEVAMLYGLAGSLADIVMVHRRGPPITLPYVYGDFQSPDRNRLPHRVIEEKKETERQRQLRVKA
jgi:hypothetical protein